MTHKGTFPRAAMLLVDREQARPKAVTFMYIVTYQTISELDWF